MTNYLFLVFFCSIFVRTVISFGNTSSGNPDSYEKKLLTISTDAHSTRSLFDVSRHKRDTESNVTNSVNVKNGTCTEWMFKCLNNKCIPFWWKCDKSEDCDDGSDELGCQNEAPSTISPITPNPSSSPLKTFKTCSQNKFQCSSGSCIPSSWLCDGVKDCSEGEDEVNCSSTCDARHFRCRKDGSCIFRALVCDHKNDCPDRTDELNCDIHLPKVPEAPSCAEGFFPCDNGCLPLTYLCNGHLDCSDFHDELYCNKTNRVYQVLQMGMDESETNETSITFYWRLSTPSKINTLVDFMPSISKIGENKWQNMTWTNNTHYIFTKLTPFTIYNITVYVRNEQKGIIFPPAKFFNAATREGIPTEPYNVTVKQTSISSVLISWNGPSSPNGIIKFCQIGWFSDEPNPSRTIELSWKNVTSHTISADFMHNKTYSFFVIATNRRHNSRPSDIATLTFDKGPDLGKIIFKTETATNSSIFLAWNYTEFEPEGFHIDLKVLDRAYPNLEPRSTKEHNITINKLSPGVKHLIKIYAWKIPFVGPYHALVLATEGKPLPEIINIKDYVVDATSIRLTWSKTNDTRSSHWIYGVYYGINATELLHKAKIETSNLSTIVSKLEACKNYTFRVGLVGPLGFGPLSRHIVTHSTFSDPKAPPKRLTVEADNNKPLRMKVQWEPSCLIGESTGYMINVYEQTTKQIQIIKLAKKSSTFFFHLFDVSYGGIYNVSVATTAPGARFTPWVTYYAPSIPRP